MGRKINRYCDYSSKDLEVIRHVRLFTDIDKRIIRILGKDKGLKFDNYSHFIRVACIRQLKEEESKQ